MIFHTLSEALLPDDIISKITSIVEQLEAPEITLEESMKLYRQGVELLTECGKSLDRIEKEMIVLTEEGEIKNGTLE
jgi:exodeoxyribonuclease VII small subunit